jgi:hypothetical protein
MKRTGQQLQLPGSSTNFEEFVKCDDDVTTTSMQQDVEPVCDVKQKERE